MTAKKDQSGAWVPFFLFPKGVVGFVKKPFVYFVQLAPLISERWLEMEDEVLVVTREPISWAFEEMPC